MATESISTSLPVRTGKQAHVHPLAPINSNEIQNAVALIASQWPKGQDLQFKLVTLQEPAKDEMVPYLEAEFHGGKLPTIDRKVFVTYYLRRTVCQCALVLAYEASGMANNSCRTSFMKLLLTSADKV